MAYTCGVHKRVPLVKINSREARQRFSELLDRVERGEDVVITRRGRAPVRLVVEREGGRAPALPDLAHFRASLDVEGSAPDALAEYRERSRH